MTPAADWRWPFTWRVAPGQAPRFELWCFWHYHCLLPNPSQGLT